MIVANMIFVRLSIKSDLIETQWTDPILFKLNTIDCETDRI